MYKNMEFNELKNFLEVYYNQSIDWNELKNVSYEYLYRNNTNYVNKFVQELRAIKNINDWDFAKEFVHKHAGRKYDKEKVKLMIDIILECLTDPNWDKESYKPFF